MAKLRTTRYDAIVLDVGLPGLDGLEIARRRIEYPLNARTPIVLVTGARAPEAVRLGFSAGVVVLMHKPFAALTFLSIIQSVIPEA
jgi:DNA-binding response OmpR family regulator